MSNFNSIVVLGPTASGKTKLACELAYHLNGEIISADSRQVYKHLTIGTGKDLEEYKLKDKIISYHLIDVAEPQTHFYLHDYISELNTAFNKIVSANKIPIICGGTGLYLDALRKDFSFTQIKEDLQLRADSESLTKEQLIEQLKSYPKTYWQQVDLNSKKRIVRGIEIAEYFRKEGSELVKQELPYKPYYIGIKTSDQERKNKISDRLKKRLDSGLIEEVEALLKSGISHERLRFFGLEYKFVSMYLTSELTRAELFEKLRTAILQYAKRQLTWFRKMEKEGVKIHWIQLHEDTSLLIQHLKNEFNY